jgi:hypothetical protein
MPRMAGIHALREAVVEQRSRQLVDAGRLQTQYGRRFDDRVPSLHECQDFTP